MAGHCTIKFRNIESYRIYILLIKLRNNVIKLLVKYIGIMMPLYRNSIHDICFDPFFHSMSYIFVDSMSAVPIHFNILTFLLFKTISYEKRVNTLKDHSYYFFIQAYQSNKLDVRYVTYYEYKLVYS